MTTTQNVTMPDRSELRALYDQAISELNPSRKGCLTTPFYAQIGNAVFEAGYLALCDTATNASETVHTVAAPAGSGKTSFSYAFLIAFTRYCDRYNYASHGSVLVVNEIEKAEEVFQELNSHLPGRCRVWTTDHERGAKKLTKLTAPPAVQCTKAELRYWPVVIVTHNFYLGDSGKHASCVIKNGCEAHRALTIIDEKPDESSALDIEQSEAQKVRQLLVEASPDVKEPMDALLLLMDRFNYADANKLFRPGLEVDYVTLNKELSWFRSREAEQILQSNNGIPGIQKVFAFAKALMAGNAYMATIGVVPHFFWYETKKVTDRSLGTVLLDATADIDGVSRIVPWRVETETPKGNYENLRITCVPQHTKAILKNYLVKPTNRKKYADWMVETIRRHMKPGQKGLVITKKCLIEQQSVPTWSGDDLAKFDNPTLYTKEYGWDIDGRKLCVIHWGTGIGNNFWSDAEIVFCFDEFILPKAAAVSQTQGYREHRSDEGALGSMKTLNSKAKAVDIIANGNRLRWTKQMALRGNARNYDDYGACGKQRLIIACNVQRFMANVDLMFPGANSEIAGNSETTSRTTWATKVLGVLSAAQEQVLSTALLSERLGTQWRTIRNRVLTPENKQSIANLGWRYVSNRGHQGAWFEKVLA